MWVNGIRCNEDGVPKDATSIERLHKIHRECASLGVLTAPAYASGTIIVPIASWYHETWDDEPDIQGWKGIPAHNLVMTDFYACAWPPSLSKEGDSIAKYFDRSNDQPKPLLEVVEGLRAAHPHAPTISFSHFVPRKELSPEKRYLFFPPLSKASGSKHLERRVAALRSDVHVFGHTHFGWDATLDDGIRYIQAPLSYPEERRGRLGSVATGETFPHADPPTPLLVYDGSCTSFPPRYDAGWSNFYSYYPRRPDLSHMLAPYVAAQGYEQVPGVGEVGWFGKAVDPHTMEPIGEPLPAWKLGPKSAVAFERSQREADPSAYKGGGELGRSPAGSGNASPKGSPRLLSRKALVPQAPPSPSSVPRSPNSFRPREALPAASWNGSNSSSPSSTIDAGSPPKLAALPPAASGNQQPGGGAAGWGAPTARVPRPSPLRTSGLAVAPAGEIATSLHGDDDDAPTPGPVRREA